MKCIQKKISVNRDESVWNVRGGKDITLQRTNIEGHLSFVDSLKPDKNNSRRKVSNYEIDWGHEVTKWESVKTRIYSINYNII